MSDHVHVHAQRGEQFARTSTAARQTISELGERFIHMGMRILVHGYSRVVLALLKQAKLQVRLLETTGAIGCVGMHGHSGALT